MATLLVDARASRVGSVLARAKTTYHTVSCAIDGVVSPGGKSSRPIVRHAVATMKAASKKTNVMLYLSFVALEVRTVGYSKVWPPTWFQAWERLRQKLPGHAEIQDAAYAHQVMMWVLSIHPTQCNEYFWKAKTLIDLGEINRKEAPLIASLLNTFQNDLAAKKRAETLFERAKSCKCSVYFGVIGSRSVFELTVEQIEPMDSLYGGFVMFLRDSNGNVAKWLTSRIPEEFQKGHTLHVRATVKDHRETYGVRHTVLTRVVIDAQKNTRPAIRPTRDQFRKPRSHTRDATGELTASTHKSRKAV